jgi:hypothetical protein
MACAAIASTADGQLIAFYSLKYRKRPSTGDLLPKFDENDPLNFIFSFDRKIAMLSAHGEQPVLK